MLHADLVGSGHLSSLHGRSRVLIASGEGGKLLEWISFVLASADGNGYQRNSTLDPHRRLTTTPQPFQHSRHALSHMNPPPFSS